MDILPFFYGDHSFIAVTHFFESALNRESTSLKKLSHNLASLILSKDSLPFLHFPNSHSLSLSPSSPFFHAQFSLQRRRTEEEMKGFRSRILRTLKSFHQVGPTKLGNGGVLLIEAPSDEFFDASPSPVTSPPHSTPPITTKEEEEGIQQKKFQLELPDTAINPIQVSTEESSDKENIGPRTPIKDHAFNRKEEETTQFEPSSSTTRADLGPGFSSYRRPDLNSSTLFDPNLLAAFRQAISDHNRCSDETKTRTRSNSEEADLIKAFERPTKVARTETESNSADPLADFEVRCPTGGKECVILYTTSLRGIRKTFEDCNQVRFVLENLGVNFHERDISMDLGYREELWKVLGFRAVPPRLFITGRYIGGAEEVITLHEAGQLRPLVRQFLVGCNGASCEGCGGMKFMMCSACHGSHSLYDGEEATKIPCLGCNENGLVPCPLCS
ncbi:hypothetical protein LUZ62_054755 [Rhynchospora pubera]|uniref:Glutaredoxin domain-containing protein n=1 Tax=Rhynchospora pubera TaxID=906938 RepID=A0AAV8DWC0_9POAL|nr:hypothetical protein LUZ62_054755 [Rhynchospora pubera]